MAVSTARDLKPDVLMWLEIPMPNGTSRRLPLMVEYDLTGEVPYNLRKLHNHDAWRTMIACHHDRFTGLGDHLGAVVFVARDREFLRKIMKAADSGHISRGEHLPGLSGQLRHAGSEVAYFPLRENLYFVLEEDIHRGSPRAFQIPPCPPKEREQLGQPVEFRFHRTLLLPQLDTALRGTQGRNWTGHARPAKD